MLQIITPRTDCYNHKLPSQVRATVPSCAQQCPAVPGCAQQCPAVPATPRSNSNSCSVPVSHRLYKCKVDQPSVQPS